MSKNKYRKPGIVPGAVVGEGGILEPVVDEQIEELADVQGGRLVGPEIVPIIDDTPEPIVRVEQEPASTRWIGDLRDPGIVKENSGPSAVVQVVKTVIKTTPKQEVVQPGSCTQCGHRHATELAGTVVSCLNCSNTIRLV